MARLKVYCTSIGFHDAYVAAPSQKAALAAWGSSADLFARGQAQLVDDPERMAEPLARPGEVIKRIRGSTEEHLAALPATPGKAAKPASGKKRAAPPRPSRAALDAAERALEEATAAMDAQLADLKRREDALARERKQLMQQREQTLSELEQTRDTAAEAFAAALAAWQAG